MTKSLLPLILLLAFSVNTMAYDFKVDGLCYKICPDGDNVMVTYEKDYNFEPSSANYKSLRDDIIIPAQVSYNDKSYSVTQIDNMTFAGCTDLTSVTIPNSVTEIGETAFYGCIGLTSITIPNSVTCIGSGAFAGCSGLVSINVEPRNTTFDSRENCNAIIETATNSLFVGCKHTQIPTTITEIGKAAFYGCTGLMSLTIPNSVTKIDDFAFTRCTALKSVAIPNSVTWIGESAFEECIGLTSVNIPQSVTKTGSSVFSGCTGLTSVTIPNSVTKIDDLAFWGCTGLTSVSIPNSVTEIGGSAFGSCTALTSVNIPNSVKVIYGSAFSGCTGLMSVAIPNSVKKIDEGAFYGCTGLTSVIIPNSVTEVGLRAFEGCTSLTSVIIPNSVTEIHYYAFSGCTGLTSVSIPNSVTWIGESAFEGCIGLTSVNIPKSVTRTGSSVFSGCTGLTSVIIPESMTEIESSAFKGCTGLTSVIIPNSVTHIWSDSFSGCTGLTSVTIPNSVTRIGEMAFSDCTCLTSVTIPKSVTEIGWGAFSGCTGLTSVNIPDSVKCIDNGVFYGCTNLTSVTIPNSVAVIGENSFSGCTSLTMVNIPQSVIEIGNAAFKDCTGLKSVTIPNSVTKIGVGAFENCINLESIVCWSKDPPISTDIAAFKGVMDRKTCNLIVPSGTIALYESVAPWCYFANKTEVSNSVSFVIQAESTKEQEELSLEDQILQYYNKEQYGKAIQIVERLLTLPDFASDSDKVSLIMVLAHLCHLEKIYGKAIYYYKEYRATTAKMNDSLEVAWVDEMLGDCYMEICDYSNAEECYLKAYNNYLSCDTLKFKETIMLSYDNIPDDVDINIDISYVLSSYLSDILLDILKCCIAQDKISDAIELYLKTQQTSHIGFKFIDDDRQTLSFVLKRGDDLCNQGLYNEASKMYKDVIGFYQLINSDNNLKEAVLKERVGRCYLLLRQYDQAHDFLNKSNEIFKNIEYNSYYFFDYRGVRPGIDDKNKTYLELANDLKLDSAIYIASQGDFITSYSCLRAALDYIYANSIDFLGNNTSEERSAYWEKYSNLFCEIYPFVVTMSTDKRFNGHNNVDPNDSVYGDLYNKSALFAKGLLLTSDNEFSRVISESGNSSLISSLKEVIALRNVPSQLTAEQKMNREYKRKKKEKEIIVVSKDYREFMDNLQLKWTDVQGRLRPDDIAIEFLSFPKLGSDSTFYIALTVRKDYDSPHLVSLCEEHELQAAAKKANTSNELSKLIWGKLSEELKGNKDSAKVKNIYFSPSGALHQVAIESMPHWKKRKTLMNQCYNIYRLSSTRELVIERESIQSHTAAIYGDINYNTEVDSMGTRHLDNYPRDLAPNYITRGFDADAAGYRGKIWDDLKYAREEVDSIVRILKNERILVDSLTVNDATETSFKDLRGQKKNIIHIATHGFCWNDSVAKEQEKNSKRPLSFLGNGLDAMTRSGLLFSGANNCFADSVVIPDSIDDGVLTAYEASMLDLRGLDLLVLSACETGLGEISAEGVFGLQRGFKKAGARSIIMSLWKVNDMATRDMMTQFYKYWIEYGMSKHKAFLKAQQYVKDHDDEYKYNDDKKIDKKLRATQPHWAAFILLDALETDTQSTSP